MTIQDAVVEAFNAWAEKLRTQPQRPAKVPQPETCASGNSGPCPHHCRPTGSAVELVSDGENRYWMLRESDAPLSVVLRAIADGVPARKS